MCIFWRSQIQKKNYSGKVKKKKKKKNPAILLALWASNIYIAGPKGQQKIYMQPVAYTYIYIYTSGQQEIYKFIARMIDSKLIV